MEHNQCLNTCLRKGELIGSRKVFLRPTQQTCSAPGQVPPRSHTASQKETTRFRSWSTTNLSAARLFSRQEPEKHNPFLWHHFHPITLLDVFGNERTWMERTTFCTDLVFARFVFISSDYFSAASGCSTSPLQKDFEECTKTTFFLSNISHFNSHAREKHNENFRCFIFNQNLSILSMPIVNLNICNLSALHTPIFQFSPTKDSSAVCLLEREANEMNASVFMAFRQ